MDKKLNHRVHQVTHGEIEKTPLSCSLQTSVFSVVNDNQQLMQR
jgi:hypothetical protein